MTNKETSGWEERFDKLFVVNENSAEEGENGELKWSEDTRLIADYIDGKTLTAKHIKDFISQLLLSTRAQAREATISELKSLMNRTKTEKGLAMGLSSYIASLSKKEI